MNVPSWATPLGPVYREWLLGLARQEADAGCPRLLAMKSEAAMYFADLTETWDAERRYDLICARIKWLFTGNFGYPPVPVTERETAASARWQPWTPWRFSRTTVPWDPAAAETNRAEERYAQEQRGAYKINKPLLKRRLNRAMQDRFGKSRGGYYYVTQVGNLQVATSLDFGVSFGQFEYMQSIQTRQLDTLMWHGGILALLGSAQTRWGRLTNEDIPATVELLVRLCGEFVDAVPGMWERSGLANVPLPDGVT